MKPERFLYPRSIAKSFAANTNLSTVSVSLFPFVPYSLFLALDRLELAPGRGIYAEANPCSFVAARAEMGAAVGRVANRIAIHSDRRRGGNRLAQSSLVTATPISPRRRMGRSRWLHAPWRAARRGRSPRVA